jgi:hypothetical protein
MHLLSSTNGVGEKKRGDLLLVGCFPAIVEPMCVRYCASPSLISILMFDVGLGSQHVTWYVSGLLPFRR